MTMITPSYLGETIEYSSLHACRSTLEDPTEICSNCHPFFTGKQKLLDTAGRVERFTKKYEKAAEAQQAIKDSNKKKR